MGRSEDSVSPEMGGNVDSSTVAIAAPYAINLQQVPTNDGKKNRRRKEKKMLFRVGKD